MRHLATALAVTLMVCLAGGAACAQAAPDGVTIVLRPGQEKAQLDGVIETLRQSGRPVTLRWEASPPGASAAQTPGEMRTDSMGGLMRAFDMGLALRLAGAQRLLELPGLVSKAWAADANDLGLLRIALALVVAIGSAFAVWAAFGREQQPPGAALTTTERWRTSLRPLARNVAATLAFGLVGWLAVRLLLPAHDLAEILGLRLVRSLAMVAAYAILGDLLLAPAAPHRRVLPLANPDWHFGMLVAYGVLGAVAETGVVFVAAAGADRDLTQGFYLVAASIVTLFKIAWFLLGRRDVAALLRGEEARAFSLRAAVAATVPYGLVAIAVLIWCASIVASVSPAAATLGTAAGATQLAAILLPVLAILVERVSAELAGRRATSAPASPLRAAVGSGVGRLLLGGLVVGVLYGLARVWVSLVNDPEVVGGLKATIRIATALVAGWALWGFLRAYFEAQLPRRHATGPAEDEPEAVVATRLSTVMPILRDLGLGATFAVTALAVLSAFGVDIGPLLAGFGVIGLAISFGSQALVKDIVAGIFFLTDDAFRVGEYIDTGKLKGTVERITLRSVQLRHQNGQVHTVPFGTLSQITNFSRDWATVKFTIRLDRDTDIEKARKAIKKVGQEMLEDPELGPEFLQPLKMQGVQDIADSALVLRCKFTARPNKPTYIQRQALRRIHVALRAAGIEFASNAVSFRAGTAGADAERAAAASTARPPDPAPAT